MIKIGISACFLYKDKNRAFFGPKTLSYIENDMATYISKKGILPVLIPDVSSDIKLDILKEMDGFVLTGGSDVAPQSYGEKPIGKWLGDAVRDKYELDILDFAIKTNKPVLGICRGFQLMNIYFGGTLYQDTCTQNLAAENHRSAELYDAIKHPISFVDNTYLAKLYASHKDPYVNTVHHQAIKKLGNNLQVFATSNDGLIESFGYTKQAEGKVMGVQWHPEFSHTLKGELIDEDLLFNAFLSHLQ
ncbi:Glutamine amidotransferase, class I [hydrothermal vent metagenome]|uniref:Glutamine amidotransferase, class I n=1 Tax=hydrothermal vent metagenome TaxID=652676 RepID=A0A3B0V439_9ZZZZ